MTMEELSSLSSVERNIHIASVLEAMAVDTIFAAAKSLLCFSILVFLKPSLLLISSLIIPKPCYVILVNGVTNWYFQRITIISCSFVLFFGSSKPLVFFNKPGF